MQNSQMTKPINTSQQSDSAKVFSTPDQRYLESEKDEAAKQFNSIQKGHPVMNQQNVDDLTKLTKDSNDSGTTPQNMKSFNNSLNCTFLENVINKRVSHPSEMVPRNVFEIIK